MGIDHIAPAIYVHDMPCCRGIRYVDYGVKVVIWGLPVDGNVVFDMVNNLDKHCVTFPGC